MEIWKQFKTITSRPVENRTIRIPEKLKTMGEIPLEHLVEGLNQLGQVRPKDRTKFPGSVGILIGLGTLLVLVISILAFRK